MALINWAKDADDKPGDWDLWTEGQKIFFSDLFQTLEMNRPTICGNSCKNLAKAKWRGICLNVATMAVYVAKGVKSATN